MVAREIVRESLETLRERKRRKELEAEIETWGNDDK
jgi:hypothetical protein